MKTPAILAVHQSLDQGRIGDALEKAHGALKSNDANERIEAEGLVGLCHYHLGSYGEAVSHFATFAACKPSRSAWFRLALTATLAGELETGADALEKALEHPAAADEDMLTPAFMHFDFASALVGRAEYARAAIHFEHLGQAYCSASIHRDREMVAAGLPALSHFLDLVRRASLLSGDAFDGSAWLKQLEPRLQGEAQRMVRMLHTRLDRR
jgi:tetratricopeptide (TPR) repeat protein